MVSAQGLLIYDGLCPYCRIFRKTVDLFDFKDNMVYLPFYATPAKRLLHAQFGRERGFTIFLFENGRVYWDRHAASRVAEHLKVPFPGSILAKLVYPAAAWAVTRAVGRWHKPHSPKVRKLYEDDRGRTYARLNGKARRQLRKLLKQ
jgi:predicted DCC family thiol-disulfide oxidoreductase YuxK